MKRKIRNLLCIVLAGAMLITLTGCGKKEEDKKEEKTIGLGEWSGDVYTNSDLDVKFTLPSGWKAATDADLAKQMQLGEDLLADEGKYMTEVAKLSTVYYLSAVESSTGSNVLMMSEKATVSFDKYLETIKTQLQSLNQMSYEIKSEGTEKLGEKTFSTITLRETSYGLDQKYYIRQEGNVFLSVIMTSIDGETTFNKLVESFK